MTGVVMNTPAERADAFLHGLLSPEEARQFERRCAEEPELQATLDVAVHQVADLERIGRLMLNERKPDWHSDIHENASIRRINRSHKSSDDARFAPNRFDESSAAVRLEQPQRLALNAASNPLAL